MERELHDGLRHDRIDDGIEPVSIQSIEIKRAALPGSLRRQPVAIGGYADMLGLEGGVRVIHIGWIVNSGFLRENLHGRSELDIQKLLVSTHFALDDSAGLFHEPILNGLEIRNDVIDLDQIENLRVRSGENNLVEK